MTGAVCVLIAAYRAERTLPSAIASALVEREVGEVIVVIDASPDDTAAVARGCDDGTGRLRIVEQPRNMGPAAARNRALDLATCPFVAILDADDVLVPGRFAALFAQPDWDFIADDIRFVHALPPVPPPPIEAPGRSRALGLSEFVTRNIPVHGRPRAELGFLKPIMARAFLDTHGLRYDERLRLGEDFLFYARALALGARFRLAESCGYLAVQRADSLSGRHTTGDLVALAAASRTLQALPGLAPDARRLLAAHARSVAVKARYREVLDVRARSGKLAALAALAATPRDLAPVLSAFRRDRQRVPLGNDVPDRRLFDIDEFAAG